MTKPFTQFAAFALLTLALLAPTRAQFGGPKVAAVSATASPSVVARGGRGVLRVTLDVGPQFHLNAHQPNDPAYIPTVFTPQAAGAVSYAAPRYPAPKAMKLSYAPKPLLVYTGRATILVPFTVAKTAKPGRMALNGIASFQGCDAKSCYPPATVPVRAAVTVR